MSYPHQLTDEQRSSLPVGPYKEESRPVTAEDRAKGIRGREVIMVTRPKTRFGVIDSADPIAWRDEHGRAWTFGQWEDGSWFKQPASFFDA